MKVKINLINLAVHTVRTGLDTRELSKKSGVGMSAICNIRSGKKCRIETAVKIANALGVEVTELLED